MKFNPMLAGSAVALILSASVQADDLITGTDTAEILNIARGFGSANLTEQSDGDPLISGRINGVQYHIYFQNCTNNTNCEDLNFYAGFLDLKPSFQNINDWNYNKRFSRAYLDEDGDACIEMDIDLLYGVSADYLDAQFALWGMVLDQFTEHVGYK